MTSDELNVDTWAVLMRQYVDQNLPRTRRMLERVQGGERLSDSNIAFLKRSCQQSREVLELLQIYPAYPWLFTRTVGLYAEIIDLGFRNEQASKPNNN